MESGNGNNLGKKIFFLHPAAVLQNQIISELAQEEFEVYIVKNEEKIRQVLQKNPDSILFASINEALKEAAWIDLIQSIKKHPETASVGIGIITSSSSDETKQKYAEMVSIRGGYVVIKSDIVVATKHLSTVLNGVDAKGRRKYIRLIIEKEANTTVNLPVNGTYINGSIKDISVVGFSCVFAEDPQLKKNSLFGDMQLRLQSQLLKAEGIVFGSRMEGNDKVYVILFSQRVEPNVKSRIRKYIQNILQNKLDEELK